MILPKIYILKGLKNSIQSNDSLYIAKAYSNLGNIFKNESLYDSAAHYHIRSLKIKEQLGSSTNELARCYSNLSEVLLLSKDYKNAKNYASNALLMFQNENDSTGIFKTSMRLGKVFLEITKYDSALFYFRKGTVYLPENDYYNTCITYGNIGAAYQMKKILDSAFHYTQKSLSTQSGIRGSGWHIKQSNKYGWHPKCTKQTYRSHWVL